MANIIIFFIISLSSFDNLCFVGSFDNILVFFPLIIINLWFVRFFDDSIRVRLIPLIISVLVHLVSLNFNIRPGSLGPFDYIRPGSFSLVFLVPLIIYGSLVL